MAPRMNLTARSHSLSPHARRLRTPRQSNPLPVRPSQIICPLIFNQRILQALPRKDPMSAKAQRSPNVRRHIPKSLIRPLLVFDGQPRTRSPPCLLTLSTARSRHVLASTCSLASRNLITPSAPSSLKSTN